jgi:hypothetical protein
VTEAEAWCGPHSTNLLFVHPLQHRAASVCHRQPNFLPISLLGQYAEGDHSIPGSNCAFLASIPKKWVIEEAGSQLPGASEPPSRFVCVRARVKNPGVYCNLGGGFWGPYCRLVFRKERTLLEKNQEHCPHKARYVDQVLNLDYFLSTVSALCSFL